MSRVVVNEIEAKVGNDITFNDIVKIDTFKGKTTAGSVTLQGEGSATTNLQQGLCKSWCNTSGVGTPALADSFNMASITDLGTGTPRFTFTNAMNNANFSTQAFPDHNSSIVTIQQVTDLDNPQQLRQLLLIQLLQQLMQTYTLQYTEI